MITLTQRELHILRRLNQDKDMVEALKKILLKGFLKETGGGVQELAASRIAIDRLRDGFLELSHIPDTEDKESIEKNII